MPAWSPIATDNTGSGGIPPQFRMGIGNVGSYQISGYPYLTGSNVTGSEPNNGEIKIEFPRVCRSFTVVNQTGENLLLHFASRANPDVIDQHHYATLANPYDAWNFAIRCKEVYISKESNVGTGSFEIVAELTGIDRGEMHDLTGSGVNSRVPF